MKRYNTTTTTKSLCTQQFELLVKCLLYRPDKAKFKVQRKGKYQELYVYFDRVEVNISQLMKRVNFSHINLSTKDSNQYIATENFGNQMPGIPLTGFWNKIKNALLYLPKRLLKRIFNSNPHNLTEAEIKVIRDYSIAGYANLNNLLYSNFSNLIKINDNYLRSLVLKTAILCSALNKLPSDTGKKLYRGEKASQSEINERISLIKRKKPLIAQPAFLSTSTEPEIANGFKLSSKLIITRTNGKSISNLSFFPHEKEYLLSPCILKWQKHIVTNGTHIFYARAVDPSKAGIENITKKDLVEFDKLRKWAKKNKINFTAKNFLKFSNKTIPMNNNYVLSNEVIHLHGADSKLRPPSKINKPLPFNMHLPNPINQNPFFKYLKKYYIPIFLLNLGLVYFLGPLVFPVFNEAVFVLAVECLCVFELVASIIIFNPNAENANRDPHKIDSITYPINTINNIHQKTHILERKLIKENKSNRNVIEKLNTILKLKKPIKCKTREKKNLHQKMYILKYHLEQELKGVPLKQYQATCDVIYNQARASIK